MSLENFVVYESKEVFEEWWGGVEVCLFFLSGFLYLCIENSWNKFKNNIKDRRVSFVDVLVESFILKF